MTTVEDWHRRVPGGQLWLHRVITNGAVTDSVAFIPDKPERVRAVCEQREERPFFYDSGPVVVP